MITKEDQPQRKGRQCFGAVEFLIADQQCHDLDRYGCDGFERVGCQVGGQTGGHHHDHGFANGAAGRQQHAADNAGQGGRNDDLPDRFGMGGAHGEGSVAQGLRHGVDHVVGKRGHERDDHETHHHAGGQRAF